MAIEKKWASISPRSFTSDGTSNGLVTLASTKSFHVKQRVLIKATAQPDLILEVKRVISKTQFYVGMIGASIEDRTDLSAYTTAASSTVSAPEQPRPNIPDKEFERAVYEEEPAVAKRVLLVDDFGNTFSPDNPLSVQLSDGSINIGTVNAELEVQLSAEDNVPNPGDVHDSIRIGDGTNEMSVNNDGSINVTIVSGGTPTPEEVISEYAEVAAVVGNVSTEVLSYTVPPTQDLNLYRIEFGGSNTAIFTVEIDSVVSARKRTYFGGNLFGEFDFSAEANRGLLLPAGTVIKVFVEHVRPVVGDFEVRLQGLLRG